MTTWFMNGIMLVLKEAGICRHGLVHERACVIKELYGSNPSFPEVL